MYRSCGVKLSGTGTLHNTGSISEMPQDYSMPTLDDFNSSNMYGVLPCSAMS